MHFKDSIICFTIMKVSVIGTGYVGLSLSVLISRYHNVVAVDVVKEKVDLINSKVSPIIDHEISSFLSSKTINLVATMNFDECKGSDYIIIAVPTNYDPVSHSFDTHIVEDVIRQLELITPESTFVIKSTVPIGFTKTFSDSIGMDNIIFSPEFLREGKALYDNLHPSRIVVGIVSNAMKNAAKNFADLLAFCSEEDDVQSIITGSTEAESIKLFANTYLALRVAYFNELDTFAEQKGLRTEDIIKGICLDPRIGNYYNNPSFGYGGYCLPKDTKQLLANYEDIPNNLMKAIVDSNSTRKSFVADMITRMAVQRGPYIGIFKLAMKSGSDNFRESSIFDVMKSLRFRGFSISIYEPAVTSNYYLDYPVIKDLQEFKDSCDVIVANRWDSNLEDCRDKVYCRDVFRRD